MEIRLLALFEMYFIKWCHELHVMNSIVAGGLGQGQTHPNRGYSKFKFLCIFKRFVTLKRAEYYPLNSQDLIVNSLLQLLHISL